MVNALINGAPESQTARRRQPSGHRPRHRHCTDQAVPITEQKLYQLTKDDKSAKVMAIVPGGPAPIADYLPIRLAANLVSAEASEGAAEFFDSDTTASASPCSPRSGSAATPLPPTTATVTFPSTPEPMPAPRTPPP